MFFRIPFHPFPSSTGLISNLAASIATTDVISAVAKWRPGHSVMPPPNPRKVPGLMALVPLFFEDLTKRSGWYSVALSPQRFSLAWTMGNGICTVESFFNSQRSARTKSSRTRRIEEPVDRVRRVSWKTELRSGHSSFILLILIVLTLELPFSMLVSSTITVEISSRRSFSSRESEKTSKSIQKVQRTVLISIPKSPESSNLAMSSRGVPFFSAAW